VQQRLQRVGRDPAELAIQVQRRRSGSAGRVVLRDQLTDRTVSSILADVLAQGVHRERTLAVREVRIERAEQWLTAAYGPVGVWLPHEGKEPPKLAATA
jgi:hypothetical protein